MKKLAVEVSFLGDPSGQPGAVDKAVDLLLARLNHSLLHLGICAERPAASRTGDDVHIVGRFVLGNSGGMTAVNAFESYDVGHDAAPQSSI